MSYWTYVIGAIEVDAWGDTNIEKEYNLKTVLSHLPIVTGSERDMKVFINMGSVRSSCNFDERGNSRTEQLKRNRNECNSYIITLQGSLRDSYFDETLRELTKFLTRLGKYVFTRDISVIVHSDMGESYIFNDPNLLNNMELD